MFISDSASVINCLFSGNEGSSVCLSANQTTARVLIANCTFAGNSSDFCPGAAVRAGPNTSVVNCIIWDNSYEGNGGQGDQISASPATVLAHNVIQGWTGSLGGENNHGNNPNFVNATGPDGEYGTEDDNLRLRANSLCIDTGDASLLPPDALDIDGDGDTREPLPIDLDGLPRVVNATVDRGAYEFQTAPCSADIDGSGTVGVNDLLAIILGWGQCPNGHQCHADLNLDSAVGVDDLLMVISGWGQCP